MGVRKYVHALFFLRTVAEVCISSSYFSHVSKRLREEANRVPAKKRAVYEYAYGQG